MKTGVVLDERYIFYEPGSYARVLNHYRFLQAGADPEISENRRRIFTIWVASEFLSYARMIAPHCAFEDKLVLIDDAA